MNKMERDTEAIAIPRTPGSPGHARVLTYLQSALVGWKTEIQEVRIRRKGENLVFRNLVATLELRAELESSIVLAAHYDSKRGLGPAATDSAVSCAILLQLARDLCDLPRLDHPTVGRLRLVFFDGEEALEEPWTRSNALWGSRALAWHWAQTQEIRHIRLFVLLDLVGTSGTALYSFWERAEFRAMAAVEAEFSRKRMFREGKPPVLAVDDDHLPFLRRGVPVVHLISVPFPDEWHTPRDTLEIVDWEVVSRLEAVLRIYLRRTVAKGGFKLAQIEAGGVRDHP